MYVDSPEGLDPNEEDSGVFKRVDLEPNSDLDDERNRDLEQQVWVDETCDLTLVFFML